MASELPNCGDGAGPAALFPRGSFAHRTRVNPMTVDVDIVVHLSAPDSQLQVQLKSQFEAVARHYDQPSDLRDIDIAMWAASEARRTRTSGVNNRPLTVLDRLAIAQLEGRKASSGRPGRLPIEARARHAAPGWGARTLRSVDRLIELARFAASFRSAFPEVAPNVVPTAKEPEVITLTMACGVSRLAIPIVPRMPGLPAHSSSQVELALIA